MDLTLLTCFILKHESEKKGFLHNKLKGFENCGNAVSWKHAVHIASKKQDPAINTCTGMVWAWKTRVWRNSIYSRNKIWSDNWWLSQTVQATKSLGLMISGSYHSNNTDFCRHVSRTWCRIPEPMLIPAHAFRNKQDIMFLVSLARVQPIFPSTTRKPKEQTQNTECQSIYTSLLWQDVSHSTQNKLDY